MSLVWALNAAACLTEPVAMNVPFSGTDAPALPGVQLLTSTVNK